MTEPLFEVPIAASNNPTRSIQDLAAMHVRGAKLLESFADGQPAIFRVRDAESKSWNDLDRRHQVTIRAKTASGAVADEYRDVVEGTVKRLVYGWLSTDDALEVVVVLDAERLAEDILDRPGCLVMPPTGQSMLHHAPGGAEFFVIDIRRLPEQTIIAGHGPVEWSTHVAPAAFQPGLFG